MCGNTTTSRKGNNGSWVGSEKCEVMVIASLLNKPSSYVGTVLPITSPIINKPYGSYCFIS
jgi:hypothetical protein